MKSKVCTNCFKDFVPQRMAQHVCGWKCAASMVAKQKKKEKQEFKERKEKLKSKPELASKAQDSFNLYIRLRAVRFGHKCISSGRTLRMGGVGGGFDAGHFRPISSAAHLRFNLNNVWGQSKHDNMYEGGSYAEYRKGLIDRRGIEIVEKLENDNRTVKFTAEYLRRIKKIFDKKSARMKKIIALKCLLHQE